MITAAQIRMGRAALQWTAQELADMAQVGVSSINRIESGREARKSTIAIVQRALEDGGVRFVKDGVTLIGNSESGREQSSFFYKYKAIDRARVERTRKIFVDREVYFPRYDQFNDPFDCRFDCSLYASRSERKKYMRSALQNVGGPMIREDREASISKWVRAVEKNPEKFEAELRSHIEKELAMVGIFSLSRVPDDVLMWSHYADEHRGFCLQFADDESEWFIRRAQEVRYSDEYPTLNLIKDPKETAVKRSFLQKAKFWEYENEWRIIDHDGGPGLKIFPSKILVGVIFGWKISQEDEALIRGWSEEGACDVAFFRAQPTKGRYALEIVKA